LRVSSISLTTEKRRWLRLPTGTAIDKSDPDHWQFPVGTQLWKQFSRGDVLLENARAELAAAGYPKVDTADATGQARPIVEPINWIVQSQEPPAGSPASPGTAVTLKVAKPTDGTGPTSTVDGVVPDVVCADLQSAQDMLQAAGFFNLWSEDATGQGRQQLIDRNWIVIRQSTAPGESPPDRLARITLSAVKFGEPTGDSGCKS